MAFCSSGGNYSRPDLTPVKSVGEFSGLQCCLLIMCSTERKAVIYYFERVCILYHWYMQEKVKEHHCSTDMYGIKKEKKERNQISRQVIFLIYQNGRKRDKGPGWLRMKPWLSVFILLQVTLINY